jgi:hypothetical protein
MPALYRISSNRACANRPGTLTGTRVVNMGCWLELVKDEFLSDQFCCVPIYGVQLNHGVKSFLFFISQRVSPTDTVNMNAPIPDSSNMIL